MIINIHAAKTHLSRLVDRASQGEEIVIARAGKPVARLVACEAAPTGERKPGLLAGRVWYTDDFDAPMQDVLDALDDPIDPLVR